LLDAKKKARPGRPAFGPADQRLRCLAAVFTLNRVRKSGHAALGLIQRDLMLAPWRRNVPQKKKKNIAGSTEVNPKGKKKLSSAKPSDGQQAPLSQNNRSNTTT
jgi:hypothetical protein